MITGHIGLGQLLGLTEYGVAFWRRWAGVINWCDRRRQIKNMEMMIRVLINRLKQSFHADGNQAAGMSASDNDCLAAADAAWDANLHLPTSDTKHLHLYRNMLQLISETLIPIVFFLCGFFLWCRKKVSLIWSSSLS